MIEILIRNFNHSIFWRGSIISFVHVDISHFFSS